jgi:hypothetical protein
MPHDIYDPPPAPVPFEVARPEPLVVTTSDVAWLLLMCGLLVPASAWAWIVDSMLGLGMTVGGLFAILESWFSGLTFLRRHPAARPTWRGLVFLAALVPWLIGIGFVTSLMLGLFWLSDLLS